jgi:hypothetical protein
MAKDSISFEFVKKLCGSNKDQIHMLSDQELGEFTRAVCNYYLLDKPKEPELKDRFLELLWKRMVPKIDKYLNADDEPVATETKPKHQRIEVKADNVELVYTTGPVNSQSEVDELDPELMYKEEDFVDDQTRTDFTEDERNLLDVLTKCKEKYGADPDGGFKAPAVELRQVVKGGREFGKARDGLVEKGLIKYDFVTNEKNRQERRYWILDTPTDIKVEVPVADLPLTEEEQVILYTLTTSHAKRNKEGWFRAPVKYLEYDTGLSSNKIAAIKRSLMEKGYIQFKKEGPYYHIFRIVKEYDYKKTA